MNKIKIVRIVLNAVADMVEGILTTECKGDDKNVWYRF